MKLIGPSVLLLCAAALWAQQDSKKHPRSDQDRIGLIELEASSHFAEGPIRGGNYDDFFQVRRARYYVPNLLDCSDRIVGATRKWADAQGATIVKSESEAYRVLLHLVKPKTPGFYELLYRVDLAKGTARLTFVQIRKGVPISPDADPKSGVAELVPLLKEALTCVQPSSSSSH